MWRRIRNKEPVVATPEDASALTVEAAAAATQAEDATFSHPGAYGAMMLPPKVVKVGFFAGRRRHKPNNNLCNNNNSSSNATTDSDAGTQPPSPSQQEQQHQLPCSGGDPARVDKLLSEAKEAREAEGLLRAESAKLLARKAELEREIQRLQKDKEDMTEAHRTQLERLRVDLEAASRDSKLRLKSELEKGHAKSMDSLRLTLRSETEHLASETKRLREDLLRARQARSVPPAERGRYLGERERGVDGGGGGSTAEPGLVTPMPGLPGFWSSLTNAFTPGDFLEAGGGRGEAGGGGVPPPALLVLAAVPLFCFYKRWQRQR